MATCPSGDHDFNKFDSALCKVASLHIRNLLALWFLKTRFLQICPHINKCKKMISSSGGHDFNKYDSMIPTMSGGCHVNLNFLAQQFLR
jgi:hypothetical protein